MATRRHFIKQSSLTAAGLYLGAMSMTAKSYGRILGANDRVRLGAIGFSDRFRQATSTKPSSAAISTIASTMCPAQKSGR